MAQSLKKNKHKAPWGLVHPYPIPLTQHQLAARGEAKPPRSLAKIRVISQTLTPAVELCPHWDISH